MTRPDPLGPASTSGLAPAPALAPATRRRGLRAAGLATPAVLAAGAFVLLGGGDLGAAQDSIGVDGARAVVEQLVETRRLISVEQAEWQLGRTLLEERIAVVSEEIQSLRARIDDTQASIGEADRAREELLAENARLRESTAQLVSMVGALETRTRSLLVRLPVPIQEKVRPLSQQLPNDPEDTRLSLSVRFQNVIGVLNEITKFNRELHVASEKRTVTDGVTTQQVEVAAMYVGIAYGFYTSSDGRYAGIGTAAGEEWTWTARNESAEAIERAIAILQDDGIADYVSLPITID